MNNYDYDNAPDLGDMADQSGPDWADQTADERGEDLTRAELDACEHPERHRFTYRAIGAPVRRLACGRCEADI